MPERFYGRGDHFQSDYGSFLGGAMQSQTSVTAAALVVAFVIFITVRGELPYYFGALGIGPTPLQPRGGSSSPTGLGASVSGPGFSLISDPVQYPGGTATPPPWGSGFGSDFGFGGGGAGFGGDAPPGVFPL